MLQKHLFYTWSRSRYIPLRYTGGSRGGGANPAMAPPKTSEGGANMSFGPPKTHESDMHISLVSFEHIYFMCAMVTYQLIFTK